MAYGIEPRGDLPLPIDRRSCLQRAAETSRDHHRHSALTINAERTSRQCRRTCYDWIFSSASNAHIATDYTSFRTYIPFKSYVLALGDQRQVPVLGIGKAVIKIRRQPGSKESHSITLENVLHVPSWMCNVLSDIYFQPAIAFHHKWKESGINFIQKKGEGITRHWGFTEDFCGLDRLVLAKDLHGRSPMLEDKDREVFSVNVTWPQGQQDRYAGYLQTGMQRQNRMEAKLKALDVNAVSVKHEG